MENDILEAIKREVRDMEKIADGDYSEIAELEKDPNVQRYLYLKKLRYSHDLIEHGKRHIVDIVIEKYGHGSIKGSNNIWCFLFESEARNIKGISFDSIAEDQVMVVYQDLEDSTRLIAIGKDKQEEFEKTHNVVFGKSSIHDNSDRYYNTRRLFFGSCITEGQEAAVKKVLSPKK